MHLPSLVLVGEVSMLGLKVSLICTELMKTLLKGLFSWDLVSPFADCFAGDRGYDRADFHRRSQWFDGGLRVGQPVPDSHIASAYGSRADYGWRHS